MTQTLGLAGAAAALGIGMLIGLERERHKGQGELRAFAGLRTYSITALLGYVSQQVGGGLLLGLIAGCLAVIVSTAYWKSRDNDPGITSEVALLTVLLLGAWCGVAPELATAVGVVVAGLLAYRDKLHNFARSQLTDVEMRDGLLLLVVALVVLPLAPDRFIGPYGALNPRTICTLTVLLMAVGAVGHVAVRALGPRYGYVVSAIASGFASSTVTVAAMGQMVAKEPEHLRILAAAAIFSNIATVAQVALILGTVEPALLSQMAWPLLAGFATTALYGVCLMWHAPTAAASQTIKVGGAFDLKLALIMVVTLTGITFLSSLMLHHFGQVGVILTATLSGFADAHASIASIAALATSGQLSLEAASIPVLLAVSCNALSKCVVAGVSGGRYFAVYVIVGQVLLVGAMWLVTWAG
ncbi:MgtC/SapB family protein [Pseudomonas veronii]|uniref:MgtC/SapB family protein n=1 Tax=Pseudomonas veronii TaxID=76761 RepID=A0A4P7Y923_PSEVE|nr:MgtC/SapB family protein [Pseudomonas veronii]MDF3242055.1 MgtC/SapB family protein [Pseudomonas veronii]QCG67551.1 MgtC/SapB family protein [Pseudomonas veronii]